MPQIIRKSKVRSQSKISVGTTIPQGVAEQLNISAGDTVKWIVDISNDKIKVTVEKLEEK